jgi:RNA polymerase sigma-70 factor (ECF subfamily)
MTGRLTFEVTGEPGAQSMPDAQPDDLALVHRAANDIDAFGLLYERYVDRIHAFCYRRLGSREAAEDATSQTFIKLLTAIRTRPPRSGSVRAWIFTIAWHVLIDGFRTTHPQSDLTNHPDLVSRDPPLDDQVIAIESATSLDLLIRQLPGKSHGAIRTAQHRAFLRLRELAQSARIEL